MKALYQRLAAKLKRTIEWFSARSLRDKLVLIFAIGVFASLFVLVLSSFILTLTKPGHYFFVSSSLFFQDASDAFMDFFNVNQFVTDMNPYYVEGQPGEGSSYPPLSLLLAKAFQLISGSAETARDTRLSVRGVLALVLYLGIFYAAAMRLFRKAIAGSGLECHRRLLYAALVLSGPMLFLLDRGNYLLYALLLMAVFLLYRNDETGWKRELSYLALAAATGIKLYPAALALLLLRERKFLPFLRTALYSVALVVLPFFCFQGGWRNIVWFWENMVTFSGRPDVFYIGGMFYTNAYSYSLSASMLVRVGYCFLADGSFLHLPAYVQPVGYALTGLTTLACLIGVFRVRELWKALACAAVLTVVIPDPSYFYGSAVMILPFVAFCADRRKTRGDIFWFVLFCIQLLPLPLGYLLPTYSHGLQHGYTLANFLQTATYPVLAVGLLIDGFRKPVAENPCV